jgi:hypothetical protein
VRRADEKKNEPCRPKESHLIFCAQWFEKGINLSIIFVMTSKNRFRQYQQLLQQLSSSGWISEGYAQNRGPGAGGPCFQWTRKVKGKTVSVALSEKQFEAIQQAIENWKKTKKILKRMQQLSREEIFTSLPGTKRRKSLPKKVLGII